MSRALRTSHGWRSPADAPAPRDLVALPPGGHWAVGAEAVPVLSPGRSGAAEPDGFIAVARQTTRADGCLTADHRFGPMEHLEATAAVRSRMLVSIPPAPACNGRRSLIESGRNLRGGSSLYQSLTERRAIRRVDRRQVTIGDGPTVPAGSGYGKEDVEDGAALEASVELRPELCNVTPTRIFRRRAALTRRPHRARSAFARRSFHPTRRVRPRRPDGFRSRRHLL